MSKPFKATQGEAQADLEEIRGKHSTNKVTLICITVILSIIALGCVVAIWIALYKGSEAHDYSTLIPVLSVIVAGAFGFFAGQKTKTPE